MSDLGDINASGNLTVIKLGSNLESARVKTEAEIDTMIADAISTDDGIPVVYKDFDPQFPAPTPMEGRIFYDDQKKALSVYTDVADFILNIGQEGVVRVYNSTGVTIANGQACRGDGSVGDIPRAVLAIADTYINSIVIGVATHDIPNGTYGFLTHIGALGFSAPGLAIDDTIYLSSTIAGGMTNVAPDLCCVIGTKLSDDVIQVNLDNHRALPTAIGWLYGIPTTYDLQDDGSFTKLVGWDGADSIFMEVDEVTGEIEIPVAGVYRIAITFGARFTPDGKNNRTFNLQLFDESDQVVLATFGFPMPDDTSSVTGTVTAPMRLALLHTLSLRIGVDLDDVSNVVFNNINFSIESIQIK